MELGAIETFMSTIYWKSGFFSAFVNQLRGYFCDNDFSTPYNQSSRKIQIFTYIHRSSE